MKPTDEKSGVRQQEGHKVFDGPPTLGSPPEPTTAEAAVFDVVYTLLGDMAATIGRPRRFNFGGRDHQASESLSPAKSIQVTMSPTGIPYALPG